MIRKLTLILYYLIYINKIIKIKEQYFTNMRNRLACVTLKLLHKFLHHFHNLFLVGRSTRKITLVQTEAFLSVLQVGGCNCKKTNK